MTTGSIKNFDGTERDVGLSTHLMIVMAAALDNVAGRDVTDAVFVEAKRLDDGLDDGKVLTQNEETHKWTLEDPKEGPTTVTMAPIIVGEVPSNG